MIDLIAHEGAPLTLLGGADVSPSVLKICLNRAEGCVAADGGADTALAAGLHPLAVIGDLDSISPDARKAFSAVLCPVDDPDTTDFEKVLQRIKAPLFLAAGFLGGRLDHTLSVLNTLARYPEQPVILLSEDDVVVLLTTPTRLSLNIGDRIAVLPLDHAVVRTTGLRWELEDMAMHPAGKISSSNEVAARAVTITPRGPVLLTLPLSALDAVIDAVHAR